MFKPCNNTSLAPRGPGPYTFTSLRSAGNIANGVVLRNYESAGLAKQYKYTGMLDTSRTLSNRLTNNSVTLYKAKDVWHNPATGHRDYKVPAFDTGDKPKGKDVVDLTPSTVTAPAPPLPTRSTVDSRLQEAIETLKAKQKESTVVKRRYKRPSKRPKRPQSAAGELFSAATHNTKSQSVGDGARRPQPTAEEPIDIQTVVMSIQHVNTVDDIKTAKKSFDTNFGRDVRQKLKTVIGPGRVVRERGRGLNARAYDYVDDKRKTVHVVRVDENKDDNENYELIMHGKFAVKPTATAPQILTHTKYKGVNLTIMERLDVTVRNLLLHINNSARYRPHFATNTRSFREYRRMTLPYQLAQDYMVLCRKIRSRRLLHLDMHPGNVGYTDGIMRCIDFDQTGTESSILHAVAEGELTSSQERHMTQSFQNNIEAFRAADRDSVLATLDDDNGYYRMCASVMLNGLVKNGQVTDLFTQSHEAKDSKHNIDDVVWSFALAVVDVFSDHFGEFGTYWFDDPEKIVQVHKMFVKPVRRAIKKPANRAYVLEHNQVPEGEWAQDGQQFYTAMSY